MALGAGLVAARSLPAWAQPQGANGDVRIGVIGLGSKGQSHLRKLLEMPGVRVVALCDVDPALLAEGEATVKNAGGTARAVTDARRLLEIRDVDAVLIASPNHWHALHSVWACEAGKDVYVEKPISRTLWEGRQMIAAARKYNRVVQAGTQFRSDTGLPEAVAAIQGGELGQPQYIHALWYKERANIGKRMPWYPTGLDYDHFCGPTPVVPLERDRVHYDWHWMWNTGNGDLANLGVHCIDVARRFGQLDDRMPVRSLSVGGRFVHEDAAETPNTQLTLFDFGGVPLFFESRGLTMKPGMRAMDQFRGIRTGVIVQCEGGYYAGYQGGGLYDNAGRLLRRIPGDGGASHVQNFIDAVRSRRTQDLRGPLELAHGSTSCCHYGNLSYRAGSPASFEAVQEAFAGLPAARESIERMREHLAAHGVDLANTPLTLGQWVHADGRDGVAKVEGADDALTERIRFLARDVQRAPYEVPQLA
jgi:predicted dehydrogenase